MTPTDLRDIPDHIMSYSAIKDGGRRRKRMIFRVTAFLSPGNLYE